MELFSARLLSKHHVIFVIIGLAFVHDIHICEFVFFYSKMPSVMWLISEEP